MRFKSWLQSEMLSPGGGNTELPAASGEVIAKDAMRTGSGGAFPTWDNDDPPSRGKNPLLKYLPAHTLKKNMMKKKMKK